VRAVPLKAVRNPYVTSNAAVKGLKILPQSTATSMNRCRRESKSVRDPERRRADG
jgi:hypothetical protein